MLVGGKYKFISKKGEGTFSEVIKAQTSTNKFVAIKRMKNHFDSIEQVNNLREVQALKKLSPHPGIIKLLEVVFERSTGRLSLVFEIMEMNIYELIRGRRHYLAEKKVKLYMYQLLKAMDHMHKNGIFHRDIKPENILLTDDKIKIADFGSCRGVKSKQPFTEYISTRWYRAPECLLTDGYYNYKMDMWGIGCVFFEVMSLFPLFPGTNELDQIQKIHNIIGTPPPELLAKIKRSVHMNFNFPPKEGTGIDRLIPNAPPECVELIKKLIAYNPDDRLSARQALRHSYFRDLREGEKRLKHGAPMYKTPDQPDEASKRHPLPESTNKKGTLPQLKQYQHSNNITNNITNINNTNINITTNNIILSTANLSTSSQPPPPASNNSHAVVVSSSTTGLASFGQSTSSTTNGISTFGQANAVSSFGQAAFAAPAQQVPLRAPPSLASLSLTSGDVPVYKPKLSNSANAVLGYQNGSSKHLPLRESSLSSLTALPNASLSNLALKANELPAPAKKKLPGLRPKPHEDGHLDKRKEAASQNPHSDLQVQATSLTKGHPHNASLPSIKGTGWKK